MRLYLAAGCIWVHQVEESRTGRVRKRPVRARGRAWRELLLVDRTSWLEQAALASGVRVDVLARCCQGELSAAALAAGATAGALADPHPSSAQREGVASGHRMLVGVLGLNRSVHHP